MFCNVVAAAYTGRAGEVTSTNTVKKIGPQTYDVRMMALIGSSFHLCSQDSGINGPLPTTFTFTPNTSVQLQEKMKEAGHLVEAYDPTSQAKVLPYARGRLCSNRTGKKHNARSP